MKFETLLNEFHSAQNKLTTFMVEELTKILNEKGACIFYDNDIFIAVDSKDSSEYEEMDFVQSVYIEDNVVWIDTFCEEKEFEDLHISEQIAIFTEIKNTTQF